MAVLRDWMMCLWRMVRLGMGGDDGVVRARDALGALLLLLWKVKGT